jgi:hypothetical protein
VKRALLIGLTLGAVAALAQDRTQAVPESGAVWLKTEITPPSPDDGGCLFLAYGANDAGQAVAPQVYPFNGARCATVRTASLNAVKKDLGVGTGAAP